jgi:quercetin dioxygenase-like cupin family protein
MAFEFFHSRADEEEPVEIPALGLKLSVRFEQAAPDGAITILETENAPGFGPPLHRHHETEIFRVMEGEYLYEVDGRRFHAKAGDLVTVPGGAVHAFVNVTGQPARQMVLMLPAMDALKFFTDLAKILADGRPNPDALNAFGAPWGVEFLGPPIRETA